MGNHGAHARARALGILVLSLVTLLGPVGAASGAGPFLADGRDPVVITFDDYPANISGTAAAPPIIDQYAEQGVVFPNGVTALRFSKKSFPAAPDLPRSRQVVVTTCYSVEFCTNNIAMAFATDTQRVAVYVGTAAALTEPGVVVMTAFDAQQAPLTRSTVELPAGGLVPAQHMLGLDDPGGRIRSVDISWEKSGSNHDHLVLDDLTITPFVARPGLTSDPSRLSLTLRDRDAQQTLIVNNTGNVALTDLGAVFRPDLVDTEPVVDIQLLGLDCLASLKPGQACIVTLAARPRGRGTTNGGIEFATPSRRAGDAGNVLLRVPVTLIVIPTASTPTTTSGSTTPTTTATVTAGPSIDQTTPAGNPTEAPATWVPPAAGVLIALLVLALIFLGGPTLRRRLRRRRPGTDETRGQNHLASPSITVRSDTGRSVIDDRSRPVLTLIAVSPRPVTTMTEDEP